MHQFQKVTPRQAVCAILQAWFAEHDGSLDADPALGLAPFQAEAARRITSLLHTRRGALLADSIGLGKTYVALAVINADPAATVLLVVPAALRAHWQQHLRKLPERSGQIIRIVSHTCLSMGRIPAIEPDLVIVDEAHAFRNPRTRRYAGLTQLAAQARLLLISATPINNSIEDLYALIRLFADDADFRDLGVPDLRAAFRAAQPDAWSQAQVDRVLQHILIRRSRAAIEVVGPMRFPHRNPPEIVRYDLAGDVAEATALFDQIVRLSFTSGSGASVIAAAELMRLQLLKRLESSAAAFEYTVQRHLRFTRAALECLSNGRELSRADFRQLDLVVDGSVQLVFEEILLASSANAAAQSELIAQLRSDRELLGSITQEARKLRNDDAKLVRLRLLLDQLSGERVLLFTQYRETAHYLWQQLHRRYRVGLIHGSEARLGGNLSSRMTVLTAFAGHAGEKSQRLEIDLLIATDVLSEGLNLQAAAVVVNYDLPWNPVVLMQRVGRIDRLGSRHEFIQVINFMPDRGLDQLLGLLERVEHKLHTIERTVGSDGAVLDLPAPGDARRAVDLLLSGAQPDPSHFSTHDSLEQLKRRCAAGSKFPSDGQPVFAAFRGSANATLLAIRRQGQLRLVVERAGRTREDLKAGLQLLAQAFDAEPADCDASGLLTRMLEALAAQDRAADLREAPRPNAPQLEAARLVLRIAASSADVTIQERAAALLIKLRRTASSRTSDRLARLLADLEKRPGATPQAVLGAVDAILGEQPPDRTLKRLQDNVIGMLMVRAAEAANQLT